MNHPLISVIMPIYNAEKYLDESIESIVNQTYTNLEIILLPGTSSDNSTEICNKWAVLDSRITIVDQDKNCTGYARNKGISASHGQYFAFCDADDKMLPNYIEKMIDSAVKNDSDIVECMYYNASEDLNELNIYNTLLLLSDFPHSFYERFGSSSVWRYIVRKDYWDKYGFSFPEINRMEDLAIYSLLFFNTSKICFVYEPLYVYRQNPSSVMHSFDDVEKMISNYLYMADYMIKEHKRLNIFEQTKRTLISQLEHHGGYILDNFPNLTPKEKASLENKISEELKTLFNCQITVYEIKALGWGSSGTGILCSLLSKRCTTESRFISNMTLRGMTNENIKTQLEALLSVQSPNVIVVDLLEETDFILKYDGNIDEYLKQWALGVCSFNDSIKKAAPNAHILIVEKYLALKHSSNGQIYDYLEKEDIATLNEMLQVMYQSLAAFIQNNIFISSIPEDSRYSLSNDPKDGHNYDQTYYSEKIMDELHFR